jgi:hypothetical protein
MNPKRGSQNVPADPGNARVKSPTRATFSEPCLTYVGREGSDLVRESIRRYAAVYRFRQLRKRVLPFAEAQGLLTDEDVFESLK